MSSSEEMNKQKMEEVTGETLISSEETMALEAKYSANNYHPLPVVFVKAEGVHVWNAEGERFYDFLSAYSAVNQGHCHPRLVKVMQDQMTKCTLSSRAFYNYRYGEFAKYVTEFFGYDRVLPSSGGAESVETALKLARLWGYKSKGIKDGEAIVVNVSGAFHGRTITIVSGSTDVDCRHPGFAPFTDSFGPRCPHSGYQLAYNDLEGVKKVFEAHGDRIAGFLVEPIQGEAGIIVPDDDYLPGVAKLCEEYNVLLIADEIQTGLCRTGKMLACDHVGVRPDMVLLAKAISGGMYPVSVVLADDKVMQYVEPGIHGSTYGGNPMASAIAMEALQILKDEKLAENAEAMGEKFRAAMNELKEANSFIVDVRGKGLLNAVEFDPEFKHSAWNVCLLLRERGLLCKPTHETTIRFAPPLVITEEQMDECLEVIKGVITDIQDMEPSDIPRAEEAH